MKTQKINLTIWKTLLSITTQPSLNPNKKLMNSEDKLIKQNRVASLS